MSYGGDDKSGNQNSQLLQQDAAGFKQEAGRQPLQRSYRVSTSAILLSILRLQQSVLRTHRRIRTRSVDRLLEVEKQYLAKASNKNQYWVTQQYRDTLLIFI